MIEINDIIENDIVIQCPTRHSALEFGRHLENNGFAWNGGQSLASNTHWDEHSEKTCYRIYKDKSVRYSDSDYYNKENIRILHVKDFFAGGIDNEFLMSDRELLIEIYRMLKTKEQRAEV